MTFGEALRQILLYSGIKSGHFAEMLGYDPSYISRWMNNEKLPSEKNNVDIFREIANCVLTNSDKRTHKVLVEKIGLSVATDAPDEVIVEVLSEYLRSAYLSQKNSIDRKRVVGKVDNNCLYLRHTDKSVIKSIIVSSIFELLQNSRDQVVEIIDTTLCENLMKEYIPYDELLYMASEGGNRIHVRKIMASDDYNRNIDDYNRLICSMMRNSDKVSVDFYFEDDADIEKEQFILIRDKLCIRVLKEPFTGNDHFLLTQEEALVDEYYHVLNAAFGDLKPIYLRYSRSGFIDANQLYNFMMQIEYHYLLPVMHLLFIDQESCSQLWERYKFTESENRRDGTINLNADYNMFNSKRSVTVYKTAILDYIFGGTIMYAGTVLFFNKEERIRHLKLLVEKIKTDSGFTLQILEDINPKIGYSELESSVFASDRTVHATCYYTSGMNFSFSDIRAVSGMNQFLRAIENLPDTYLLKDRQVVDFLQTGINILQRPDK